MKEGTLCVVGNFLLGETENDAIDIPKGSIVMFLSEEPSGNIFGGDRKVKILYGDQTMWFFCRRHANFLRKL